MCEWCKCAYGLDKKPPKVFTIDMSKVSREEAEQYILALKKKFHDVPPPNPGIKAPGPGIPPRDRYNYSINIRIQHFIWVCYRMCVTKFMEFINGRPRRKKTE